MILASVQKFNPSPVHPVSLAETLRSVLPRHCSSSAQRCHSPFSLCCRKKPSISGFVNDWVDARSEWAVICGIISSCGWPDVLWSASLSKQCWDCTGSLPPASLSGCYCSLVLYKACYVYRQLVCSPKIGDSPWNSLFVLHPHLFFMPMSVRVKSKSKSSIWIHSGKWEVNETAYVAVFCHPTSPLWPSSSWRVLIFVFEVVFEVVLCISGSLAPRLCFHLDNAVHTHPCKQDQDLAFEGACCKCSSSVMLKPQLHSVVTCLFACQLLFKKLPRDGPWTWHRQRVRFILGETWPSFFLNELLMALAQGRWMQMLHKLLPPYCWQCISVRACGILVAPNGLVLKRRPGWNDAAPDNANTLFIQERLWVCK